MSIPSNISAKIGANLHNLYWHPVCRVKRAIQDCLARNASGYGQEGFVYFDDLSPIVTEFQNFDSLLVPTDHVSRRESDNYWSDDKTQQPTH